MRPASWRPDLGTDVLLITCRLRSGGRWDRTSACPPTDQTEVNFGCAARGAQAGAPERIALSECGNEATCSWDRPNGSRLMLTRLRKPLLLATSFVAPLVSCAPEQGHPLFSPDVVYRDTLAVAGTVDRAQSKRRRQIGARSSSIQARGIAGHGGGERTRLRLPHRAQEVGTSDSPCPRTFRYPTRSHA
jgi:hypothetical protein